MSEEAISGYYFDTWMGRVYILKEVDEAFHIYCGNHHLGTDTSPQFALNRILEDHCLSPGENVPPSLLGVPRQLSDWEVVPME